MSLHVKLFDTQAVKAIDEGQEGKSKLGMSLHMKIIDTQAVEAIYRGQEGWSIFGNEFPYENY